MKREADVEGITAEEVQAFGAEILGRLHIETLIHGNSTSEVCKVRVERVSADKVGSQEAARYH